MKNTMIFSMIFGILLTGLLFTTSFEQNAYAANANLFVSAEHSQFNNFMSGPQVIEVVVIDSDIADTTQAKGEPDVTVNGRILRMVQAVDGNWYGYFADRLQVQTADSISIPDTQIGLDFGELCTPISASVIGLISFTDTAGVAFPTTNATGASEGLTPLGTCTSTGTPTMTIITDGSETYDGLNVVRKPKAVADPSASLILTGQIGIEENFWPFIQLYDFNPTGNVVVQYNKGGGAQSVTLTFDTVDQFAGFSLDALTYPPGSDVRVNMTDIQLNIDPTDEDSWTWGTLSSNSTLFYGLFDETGTNAGEAFPSLNQDIIPFLSSLMFGSNGQLLVVKDFASVPILQLEDNNIQNLSPPIDGSTSGGTISSVDQPVTFVEQSSNSGFFLNYDNLLNADIDVRCNAIVGDFGVIDYNNDPQNVIVSSGTCSSTELTKISNVTSTNIGEPVLFTYNETNDGILPITNVTVSDNTCSPVTPVLIGGFNVGDINGNTILDSGESWQFECVHLFSASGNFTNIAIGNGTDPFGTAITFPFDQDEIANATVNVIDPMFCDHPISFYNVIFGTPLNDFLIGTSQPDLILGFDGDDSIDGQKNNDCLIGGAGNDIIDGGRGKDTIFGGLGNDVLTGDNGRDVISGGNGNDVMFGSNGNDSLFGGLGDDVISGNAGKDLVHGDDGNDTLYGNNGGDKIFGDSGNDILWGNNNNDSLDGGADIDVCVGGGGSDTTICETVIN